MMYNLIGISNEVPCVSLSQNLNTASKIDVVSLTTQPPVMLLPRMPGLGKEHIVEVAPDFDAPIDLGV